MTTKTSTALSDADVSDLAERTQTLKDGSTEWRNVHNRLAREFGRRHGWTTSTRHSRPFGISELSGIPVDPDLERWEARLEDEFPHHFTDHAWFYRDSAGRPAAVAAHLYDVNRQEVEAWSSEYGLRVTFPTDFPSWWYPDRTTLVLYERGSQ